MKKYFCIIVFEVFYEDMTIDNIDKVDGTLAGNISGVHNSLEYEAIFQPWIPVVKKRNIFFDFFLSFFSIRLG